MNFDLSTSPSFDWQSGAYFSCSTPPSVFPDPPKPPLRRAISNHTQFLLFVKILVRCIERCGDRRLLHKCKAAVRECTYRNRMGDPTCSPLQDTVERRLRTMVGELHWTRAKILFDLYCAKKGLRAVPAAMAV